MVGLQEVSRGWLLNGSTDMIAWLQRRLDLPYVRFFATTEDPLWGNAVLSRYPILETDRGLLPVLDTRIRRGYLSTVIDLGDGMTFRFVTTHLHHTGDDLQSIHRAQLDTLLAAWDEAPRTVLVGDLNARPGWPELHQLAAAGFRDAWNQGGEGPGLTANAADPQHRIDWILYTQDLTVRSARVAHSTASDHFLVTARIDGPGGG